MRRKRRLRVLALGLAALMALGAPVTALAHDGDSPWGGDDPGGWHEVDEECFVGLSDAEIDALSDGEFFAELDRCEGLDDDPDTGTALDDFGAAIDACLAAGPATVGELEACVVGAIAALWEGLFGSHGDDSDEPGPDDSPLHTDGECFEGLSDAEIDALSDEEFFAALDHCGAGDVDDWDGEEIIATYRVEGDWLVGDGIPPEHQAIWDRFVALIPAERRQMVRELEIFSDGREGATAAVAPLDDPTTWLLAFDPEDMWDLDASLIHEFGHLLTLASDQVDPEVVFDEAAYEAAARRCATYFTGDGCSLPGSYVHAFVDRFWAGHLAELERIESIPDDESYWDALDRFYLEHRDEFVTDYAATNPVEDIAESWTAFVMEDRPSDTTIAGQKVLFFYDFPELVELRAQIRAAL